MQLPHALLHAASLLDAFESTLDVSVKPLHLEPGARDTMLRYVKRPRIVRRFQTLFGARDSVRFLVFGNLTYVMALSFCYQPARQGHISCHRTGLQ